MGDAVKQLQKLNSTEGLKSDLKQAGAFAKQSDENAEKQSKPVSYKQEDAGPSVAGSPTDAGNQTHSQAAANLNGANGCPKDRACPRRTSILKGSTENPYPFFTTAFWIDGDGQQRIKWTVNSVLPSYFSVGDRSYFKSVLADRAWDYKGVKFFVEPVYSKATGSQQVILSMPLNLSKDARPEWVSGLDIRALSLVQTVLPEALGYGYSVIDSKGKILFHSDDSRNLVEDFFRESDNDITLRNACRRAKAKR